MRVICIDNSSPITPHLIKPHHWISEGEIYTVIEESQKVNGLFYTLEERYFGLDTAIYLAKRFIPISEIDEMDYYTENVLDESKILKFN